MENYKKFEVKNDDNEYNYNYDFGINNLYNINVQEENDKKFDTLLNGILSNNINIRKKTDELS